MNSSLINDLNSSYPLRFGYSATMELLNSSQLGSPLNFIQSLDNTNNLLNELTALDQENHSSQANNSNANELINRIRQLLIKVQQPIILFEDDKDVVTSKMDIIRPIEKDDDKKYIPIFEFLGQGSYGKVSKCLVNSKLMYGALKMFKNEFKDSLILELSIYYKLLQGQHSNIGNHPNIANILEFGMNNEGYYLLLDLGSGTLLDLIKYFIKYGQKLTLPQVLILIKKITLGIRSLHQNHIVHRDLKLDNILIFNHECLVKISDFSHACIFDEDPNIPYQITGNEQYRPPEVNELRVKRDSYDAMKYDIFQIGIIFDTLREFVCDGEAQTNEILRNIIEMTKNPNPLLRKSADEIVNFIDMHITDKMIIHNATTELLYAILKTSEELKIMNFNKDISKWFQIAVNYKEFGLRTNYTLHILNNFFLEHKQNDQSIFTDDIVKLLLWGIPYWIIPHRINCLHLLEAILKKLNSINDGFDKQMFLYHIKALHLTAKVFLNIRPGEKSFARVIESIKEKFQQIGNEKDTLTKLVISCTTYNTFKRIHEKCIFEKWNRYLGRFTELYNEFSNSKPQLISIEKLIQQHLDTFIMETINMRGSQVVASVLPNGFDSWLYEQIIECLTDTAQRFKFSQMILQRLESLITSTYSSSLFSSSFGKDNKDNKDRDLHTLKITLLVQLSLDCPKLEDSKVFLTQVHKEIEDKGEYIMHDIYALYYYAKGILIYRECNANGDANANAIAKDHPHANADAIEEEKEVSNPIDLTNKLIESSQFLEKAFVYLLEIKARHELKIKILEKLVEIFFKLGDIRKLKKYLNNYIRQMLKIRITNQNEKELLSRLLGLCYLYVYIGQFEKIQKKIEEMWHLIPYEFYFFEQYTECFELFKIFNNDGSFEQKILFSLQFEKAVSECCFIYRDLETIYQLAKLSFQVQIPNACITMEDQKFLSSFDQYKENYLQRKSKVENGMSNPDYTLCSKHLSFEDSGKTCLPLEIKSIKKDNGYLTIKGNGYVVFNKGATYTGDFIIFIFSNANTLKDNIIHDIKCLGCFLNTHHKEDNIRTMFIFENGQGIFENSDYRTVQGKQKMSNFEGKVIKKGRKFQKLGDSCACSQCLSLLGDQVAYGEKVEFDIYEGNYFDSMSNGYGKYEWHGKNQFDCYRRNNLAFGNAALIDHSKKSKIEAEWFYDTTVQRVKLD